MVLERNRPHAALGRLDGDLNHILRAVNKVRVGVDMTVDRSFEQLVLDSRIDLKHLRVVLQHLIKVILGVELAYARHAQGSPDHQFLRGLRICGKITHEKISLRSFSVQRSMFKVQSLVRIRSNTTVVSMLNGLRLSDLEP